ncbi:hypothetical protein L0222_14220 [bacterium]|nr:hypothetical protein [bacterium]MCI0605289.1 hypothetical protein [bacterium]
MDTKQEVKQIERELDELDYSLTLLKRDYEVYFSGGAKLPPLDAHRKLERNIRKYAGITSLNYAQRFRYNNITARFQSYVDLWTKQMRYKEEGRTPSGGIVQVPETPKKESRKSSADAEANKFQKLFNEYLKTCQKSGENKAVSFEKFSEQLAKQKEAILERYKCKDVEFYVTVEQGKTKLKAKPIK